MHKILELLSLHEYDDQTLLNRIQIETQLKPSPSSFKALKEQAKKCMTDDRIAKVFEIDSTQQALNEYSIAHNGQINVIDRLIISDQQVWIIDFKTQQELNHQPLQQQAEKFTAQLSRYKSAVSALYPNHSIRCSIIFTRAPALIDLDIE